MDKFHRVIGFFMAGWGCLVMMAWKIDLSAIIAIPPHTAPMQFNTALCFVALGLSKAFSPKWPLLVILGVSLPTLIQDLGGINFGIDEFFHQDPHITDETPVPGRMSPATGLFFILLSGFGLTYHRWPELTALVYSFVFAASLGFTVSYLGFVPNLYQLNDESTSIALITALLFAVFSGTALRHHIRVSV